MRTILSFVFFVLTIACMANGRSYHVALTGNDRHVGSQSSPLRTIQAAAMRAQPGDRVVLHEGVYRERVSPPRGGSSDNKRIVYENVPGETVVIKGSEIVKGWEKLTNDVWKVTLPNSFFGEFNPFQDVISGDWFHPKGRVHHTGSVFLRGHWLKEAAKKADLFKPVGKNPLWFAQVGHAETIIWAQFKGADPDKEDVEVSTRRTVFYPDKPGIGYITVRGFTMEHAATPWAPPTAEQIGLVGTHWSRGWIIENNIIRYSACSGVTLGKYGDKWDNKAATAKGYVGTINRALENGWSKMNIGQHIVRNNHISFCGQAGIVGSMGAVFSTITGNEIHDIHIGWSFSGFEMAGIKFHGAIDTVISHNHIYRCGGYGGIWLDWMTQGTRVTGNLLHNNRQDLFVEVNHGPFLVDNNVFLSPAGLLESCGGGAYVHNLFGCQIRLRAELTRKTPFHKPHSTEILGLSKVVGDDERFYNNLFVAHRGLSVYGEKAENLRAADNVYLAGAQPSNHDRDALVVADFDPAIRLQEKPNGWWLDISIDPDWTSAQKRGVITTESLARAMVSSAPYENPNGTPYRLDTDFFAKKRNTKNPAPGPFRFSNEKKISLKVWPKDKNRKN